MTTPRNIGNTRDLNSLDREDILSYWPFGQYPPRISQEIIQEWVQSLDPKIKYIIAEVPVGGGKSPLALNLSGWFSRSMGNAYLMTPQKVLQKQYEESFEEYLLHTAYGKSNYKCEPKNTNCDIGGDIKPRCSDCPYKISFKKIGSAPNVVMNYSLALNLFKYAGGEGSPIQPRKLIVFDEAHTLEHHLTEFNAFSFSEMRCKRLGIKFKLPRYIAEAMTWINREYLPALETKIHQQVPIVKRILDEMEFEPGRKLSGDETRAIKDLRELREHRDGIKEELCTFTIDELDERYVLVSESKTSFKFKELYGKYIFRDLVEPMADRFVFMSSTILDKKSYCSDLGIDPELTSFISIPSEFDKANRPVMYMPTAKMTYGWDKEERKADRVKMINRIVEICKDVHDDDSGIIHAGSFQVAKWLVEELSGKIPHQIMHHNPESGYTRDAILQEFQEDDGYPKILISPSITEGLDLKHDKGRFAIFAKVPYPYLGDAWVKKRMELSTSWYSIQALIGMIQGGGRVVRSPDDWGNVYILDTAWDNLYRRSKYMIPKWWKEAYSEH